MPDHENHRPRPRFRFRFDHRAAPALVGAGLLALGGAAGAVVTAQGRPSASMAPAAPVAIGSLSSAGIVTIRGRVAQVYGNKFVMEDKTGRALVDTGREGDERRLVVVGRPVTVQGRFERGFVRAAFLVGADNEVLALEPPAGSPRGPRHDDPGHCPAAPTPTPPSPGPVNDASPPPPAADVAAPTTPSPTTRTR